LVAYAASLFASVFAGVAPIFAPFLTVVAAFFAPVLAVFAPLFATFHPWRLGLVSETATIVAGSATPRAAPSNAVRREIIPDWIFWVMSVCLAMVSCPQVEEHPNVDLDQESEETRHAILGWCSISRRGAQMGILSWIVLGLIAGFIGSKIVDRQGQGFWLDIGLGVIGAIVGGYLFSLFGKEGVSGLNLYSMLVAIAGSVVVLLLYNLVTGQRRA
jgi:uncharacterized membrane protein YeaQ/YmgE (transglycosylase-associated protein family)